MRGAVISLVTHLCGMVRINKYVFIRRVFHLQFVQISRATSTTAMLMSLQLCSEHAFGAVMRLETNDVGIVFN
jgi:hypothetical protein